MRITLKDTSALQAITKAAASTATKKVMGEYLLSQAQRAFQDQRRGPVIWPPRKVPNVAGVLRDLDRGPTIKERRWDPRPALVDTGRLGRYSLGNNYEATSRGFEVFTTLEYAPLMQEGGKARIEITDAHLENLKIALRRARKAGKSIRKKDASFDRKGFHGPKRSEGGKTREKLVHADRVAELGWLFHVKKTVGFIEITVPPRPFLTIEADDVKAMEAIAVRAAEREAKS